LVKAIYNKDSGGY